MLASSIAVPVAATRPGLPAHPQPRKTDIPRRRAGAPMSGMRGSSSRTCTVCGQAVEGDDIRLLNHMMERHGFRNPNVGKPDRNSRGY